MASKRARKRAEFLVTSNRGVLADIIPAVANALDQAWEDADNRVAAERERWKDKLNTKQAYEGGLEHGALAERLRIAAAIRKMCPSGPEAELAASCMPLDAIADSIEREEL